MLKGILSFLLLVSMFVLAYYGLVNLIVGFIIFDFLLGFVLRKLGIWNPKPRYRYRI